MTVSNPFDNWAYKSKQSKAADDADQTELTALAFGSAPLDEGMRDDVQAGLIEESELPEDGRDLEEFAQRDIRIEDGSGELGQEIRRRSRSLGEAYPFSIERNSLTYAASRTGVYEFCLAICTMRDRQGGQFQDLQAEFEHLTAIIIQSFLGDRAGAYRIGLSGDSKKTRSPRVAEHFRRIYDKLGTGEWKFAPAEGYPKDPSYKQAKDIGIDVIAWRLFGDERKGNLYFVGQCTCGRSTWEGKFDDTHVQALSDSWFRPLSIPWPSRFFATPLHIPNNVYFGEVNSKAGMTLDRIRMTLLAEQSTRALKGKNYHRLIKPIVAEAQES